MIGKRSPGDRFIPSQDWNTLADMANRGMIGTQDRERTTNGNQSVIIKVRNDTGDTLARRSIVGLGGSAIDYAAYPAQWKRDIAIIAEVPEVGTHDKKWAIIQDSIPDGGYGEAVLYGVSQCTVYVNDESHGYASIADGETGYLTSGASGTAIILWKESGTGSKLALVQHVTAYFPLIGKAGSSITKGSTGNVTIWNGASGSEASTGETINCRALFAAVAANKWCVMENINGNWYVSQVEC